MGEGSGIPIRVVCGTKALQAELLFPALGDPTVVTREDCIEALRDVEIEINSSVERRIDQAIESLRPGTDLRVVVAEAQRPKNAEDGRVHWLVGPEADEPVQPDTADPDQEGEPEDEVIDYYAQTSYTMVTAGQILGEVIPPTEPTDGRDVRGQVIHGKRGRAAKFRHDDSITVSDEGNIIASTDGVLSRTMDRWAVREYLQIPGYVDFSTGNVEFTGDIEVVRGVKDCFSVRADGNLEVLGLIEAAHLHAGGDLNARGGIAARHRGTLTTKGALIAKYIDAAHVDVGGALRVLREIINSTIVVHGDVESPGATMMGGMLTPTGRIRLGAIGSPAGVTSRLVLGTVPRIEPKLAESERLIGQLAKQMESLRGSSPDYDRAAKRVAQLVESRDRLREMVESMRTIDVGIMSAAHTGTQFVLGERVYQLRDDVPGPLFIRPSRDVGLIFRIGKEADFAPLTELCDPDLRTAA